RAFLALLEIEDRAPDDDLIARHQPAAMHVAAVDRGASAGLEILELVGRRDAMDRDVRRLDLGVLVQVDVGLRRTADDARRLVQDERLAGERAGAYAQPG